MDDRPPAREGRGQDPAYMPARPPHPKERLENSRVRNTGMYARCTAPCCACAPERREQFVCGVSITIPLLLRRIADCAWVTPPVLNGLTPQVSVANTPLRLPLGRTGDETVAAAG